MSIERYRRGLLRPTTEGAAEALREGDLPDPVEVEHYRIADDDFERYFPLFNDLDRLCGVAGDDHAVEEVEPDDRLGRVLAMLKTYPRRDGGGKLDARLDEMLDRMWGLCYRAKAAGLPVFFVL